MSLTVLFWLLAALCLTAILFAGRSAAAVAGMAAASGTLLAALAAGVDGDTLRTVLLALCAAALWRGRAAQ